MSDKCKIILFSFKSNKNTRQQTHLMMRSVMTGGVAHWVVATREGPLRAGRPCRRHDESEKRENGRGKSVAVRAKCDGGGSIKWERERERVREGESEREKEWEREREIVTIIVVVTIVIVIIVVSVRFRDLMLIFFQNEFLSWESNAPVSLKFST